MYQDCCCLKGLKMKQESDSGKSSCFDCTFLDFPFDCPDSRLKSSERGRGVAMDEEEATCASSSSLTFPVLSGSDLERVTQVG